MAGLLACLPLQRDAAFHGSLQASELIEDPDRALKDRLLDPGDLFTGVGIGSGGAGGFDPVFEYRLGSLELPGGAGDRRPLVSSLRLSCCRGRIAEALAAG